MEEEWGGPSLRPGEKSGKKESLGEVDYKSKSGTAWSHNYLNQKPWHPLSYPNQRRKWIAEQMHAQKERRAEEIAREFSQEQEFFRQTALASKKEKEKMEMMKAVSFMYVRPPGYNAESAKAAEIADEKKKAELDSGSANQPPVDLPTTSDRPHDDRRKNKPKDVFGRVLPSEEDFDVLKNAPRLETGAPVRIKPFAVEIRNVRCVRCGTYGHQSGDRECPLKDAITAIDESRLMREDPLRAIVASTDSNEPVKWELKQRPGMSPPRGGFQPDDPNQQIVPEDIFDEYGGFLADGGIPSEFLTNLCEKKNEKHSTRKRKHKRHYHAPRRRNKGHNNDSSSSDTDKELERSKSRNSRHSRKSKGCLEESEISAKSSEEQYTCTELKRRKSRNNSIKKRTQHHEESQTSRSSSEELPTHRESKQRKLRNRQEKDRRRHHEDSKTSASSSEGDGRGMESRKSKSKHTKENRCYEYPHSDRWETSSGRGSHGRRLMHSTVDSFDSRTRVRKSRSKHKITNRSRQVSDRDDRGEESKKRIRTRTSHSSDSSSTSEDDRDHHSSKRKHRHSHASQYQVGSGRRILR